MVTEIVAVVQGTGAREFMRLGVRIDGEARPPWARQQSFPARAVQPLFRPESPSQAKDDYANRDSSPDSRPSPAGARIHSSRRRDPGIRGEWNRSAVRHMGSATESVAP